MLRLHWLLGVMATILLQGCGESASSRVEREVTGKVTFQGQPVTEGTVQFEDSANGHGGSAGLTADGSFSVTLSEGSFKVAVLPPTEITPDTPQSPGGEVVKDVKNIPPKYRSLQSSPLEAQVSAERLTHDFDLTP